MKKFFNYFFAKDSISSKISSHTDFPNIVCGSAEMGKEYKTGIRIIEIIKQEFHFDSVEKGLIELYGLEKAKTIMNKPKDELKLFIDKGYNPNDFFDCWSNKKITDFCLIPKSKV